MAKFGIGEKAYHIMLFHDSWYVYPSKLRITKAGATYWLENGIISNENHLFHNPKDAWIEAASRNKKKPS